MGILGDCYQEARMIHDTCEDSTTTAELLSCGESGGVEVVFAQVLLVCMCVFYVK